MKLHRFLLLAALLILPGCLSLGGSSGSGWRGGLQTTSQAVRTVVDNAGFAALPFMVSAGLKTTGPVPMSVSPDRARDLARSPLAGDASVLSLPGGPAPCASSGSRACTLEFLRDAGINAEKLHDATDDPALNAQLAETLEQLYLAFQVSPRLYVYDDAGAGAAFAQDARYDWSPGPNGHPRYADGTIGIGVALLEGAWSSPGGDIVLSTVLAHLFHHIVQCKWGATVEGVDRELKADARAGWFLTQEEGAATTTDIEAAMGRFFEHTERAFNRADVHGMPDAHLRAIRGGLAWEHGFAPTSGATTELNRR